MLAQHEWQKRAGCCHCSHCYGCFWENTAWNSYLNIVFQKKSFVAREHYMPSAPYNSFILQKSMGLPKSIPLPVISYSTEANEHSPWSNVSNKAVSSRCRTFIDAVTWSVGKILIFLQLQNSFLFTSLFFQFQR